MGSHINPEPKGIVYLNDKKFSLAKKFHNALIALGHVFKSWQQ